MRSLVKYVHSLLGGFLRLLPTGEGGAHRLRRSARGAAGCAWKALTHPVLHTLPVCFVAVSAYRRRRFGTGRKCFRDVDTRPAGRGDGDDVFFVSIYCMVVFVCWTRKQSVVRFQDVSDY